MTEPGTVPDRPDPDFREPDERLEWAYAVIWLVFLVFPIAGALQAPVSTGRQVAGVLLVVAFGAVYTWAFVHVGRLDSRRAVRRIGVRTLGVLSILTAATVWVVGAGGVGVLPFLVSLAMFTLPVVGVTSVIVGCLLGALFVPMLVGEAWMAYIYVPVVLAVSALTATLRILGERSDVQRRHEAELAVTTERDRMARDVHDVLGHSLTVVTVKAELAERLVDLDPERAKAELASIRSLTRQALSEIRATVAGSRMSLLANELEAAQVALAGAGISATLPEDPEVADPRHRLVMGWALREAVTNVVRHSGASSCVVEVGPDWLKVTDDGVGLPAGADGDGLRGMRDRARGAGGTMTVSRAESGGSVVEVLL